jgi:signal transduction histidine kinase
LASVASVAEAFNRLLAIRRQKEAEVEKLNHELEQRVKDRTAELEATNAELHHEVLERRDAQATLAERSNQLEVANQELEAFAHSVSHDLRAPLRAISFTTAGRDHGEAQRRAPPAGRIHVGVRRMGQLISLLNLSRLARRVPRCPSTSARWRRIAGELKERPPATSGFIQPASGAVTNNCARGPGQPAGQRRRLPATRRAHRIRRGAGGRRHVFIRDNGAGFDVTYQDKLFKSFSACIPVRATRTGIGLATVQRIIRRHGGRVWGEGELGKGATFYFTLAAG